MTIEDPPRLLSGADPRARELLRSATLDEPTAAQLERLAARLPASAPAPASGLGLKAAIAVAVLGGAAIAVLAWRSREPAPPSRPTAVTASAIAPAPIAAPAPVPVPAPVSVPASVAAPVPASVPVATARTHLPPSVRPERRASVSEPGLEGPPALPSPPTPSPPAPSPPPPAPPSEISLLAPAQDALHTNDPARALALATDHARLYPDGLLTEEREAIAIEALTRLGRTDDARARLQPFAQRYPRSTYRARLDRLTAASPPR